MFNQKEYKQTRKRLRHNMTKAEVLLWLKLKNSQLGYKFRRQHGISNYIVDFYCPELKLVVELYGGIHGTEGRPAYDQKRENYLKKLGFKFKKYTNEQVFTNIEAVLQDILK